MKSHRALWTPSEVQLEQCEITKFQGFLQSHYQLDFGSYQELHQWSINSRDQFWQAVWNYCDVITSEPYDSVLENPDAFPTCSEEPAEWFKGARLNFAENLLRFRDERIALVSLLENGERRSLSYRELFEQVEKLASALLADGVKPGDRIAGLMPNIPEAVVAMLATTSIGAIWSSCSPDFGKNGVLDRFGQIHPKIVFATDGYFYNGKTLYCKDRIEAIGTEIPGIKKLVIKSLIEDQEIKGLKNAVDFDTYLDSAEPEQLRFQQLPFSHPVYIMYSSGTTGAPKCIVHGAGGTLLQHMKEHRLHTNIGRNDVLFYFSTCGWMMWNWLVSGLSVGCTLLLYDGSPFARKGKVLLDAIDEESITVFGTSAKYIAALEKSGIKPKLSHKLDSLKAILSTGSPLSHESFDYVYRDFKEDVCLSSISGGTDIISCFALGNPTLPVYKGELQCLGLGMAVEIWNEKGESVIGEKGELVCTKPFPSCPVGFWNDPDGDKFHAAYFDTYDNVWVHGDYGEITEHGGLIVHGRSDAVLNPGGVRIGTAEIYRQVEKLDYVVDSLVVGQEWEDDVRVILFVVTRDGIELDSDLTQEIKLTIRENATPRHVPAIIIEVPDIPRTISGKIVELAVKNIIHNRPVVNQDALANPEALLHFENLEELRK